MAASTTVDGSVRDERVSDKIVSAVAELTDSDPVSLDPLYDVVDPDALDELFETTGFGPDRTPERVAFTYCGFDVVVSADGSVHASKSEQERSIPREHA